MADGDLQILLAIRADAAPAEAALKGMVGSAREAAVQISAAVRAGFQGQPVPAPDFAAFDAAVLESRAQAEAAMDAFRAQASEAIVIPPMVPPPPVEIPTPTVDPPVIPAPDTTGLAAVRAQVEAMLARPFEELGLTFADVQAAKSALDRQMTSAASSEARGQIVAMRASVNALETEMQAAAIASANVGTSVAGVGGKMGNATQFATALGYSFNDAAQFSMGFDQGVRAIANNIPQLIQGMSNARKETGSWKGAVGSLASGLTGAGGLIVGVSLATSVIPALVKAVQKSTSAHRAEEVQIERNIGALRRLAAERAAEEYLKQRRAMAAAERDLKDAEDARERARANVSSTGSAAQQDAAGNAYVRTQAAVVAAEREVAASRARIAALDEEARENLSIKIARNTVIRNQIIEQGELSEAQGARVERINAQIERDQTEQERRRRIGTQSLADEQIQEAEQAARREDAASRRLVRQALQQERTAERGLETARQAAAERLALENVVVEAQREAGAESRIHQINLAEERLAIVHATLASEVEASASSAYVKAQTLAGLERDRTQLSADLARQRADIERETTEASVRAERDHAVSRARALSTNQAELDREIRALNATRDADLQEAARAHELALLQIARTGAEARAQYRSATRATEADMDDAVMESIADQAQAILDQASKNTDQMLAEAERAQDRVQQMAEDTRRAVSLVIGDVADALSGGGYSAEERDMKREQLEAEEQDLVDSLRRRGIDQEKYDRKLRALRLKRSDFEERVAADERSAMVRGADAAYGSLKGMLADWLQEYAAGKLTELVFHTATEEGKTVVTLSGAAARIAAGAVEIAGDLAKAGASMVSAAASQIASIVKSIPFPFNLAAIPVGVAGLYGAYQGAKNLFGFKVGGYTGDGDPDQVAGPVHAGEYVFDAPVVAGRAREFDALRSAMRQGVTPSQLLGAVGIPVSGNTDGYRAGGFVSDVRAVTSLSSVSGRSPLTDPVAGAAGGLDLSGIERQFARIADEVVRTRQEAPVVAVDGYTSRRIAAAGAKHKGGRRTRRFPIRTNR